MSTNAFDKFAAEYDEWFETHHFAYQSEIEAVKYFIPSGGVGIEIGVGTGRFSLPLNIKIGVEPSEQMAALARARGIAVKISDTKNLPFPTGHFDFVLMVTVICFIDNPMPAINEAGRVLKPNGKLIIAVIDKESELGKKYESMKSENKFYKDAKFYSTKGVIELLLSSGFIDIKTCQTIFSNPETMTSTDIVKEGYGEGAFVVISAVKLNHGKYEDT